MVSIQLCSPQSYLQRKGIRLHSDLPFSDSLVVFEVLLWLESEGSNLSSVTQYLITGRQTFTVQTNLEFPVTEFHGDIECESRYQIRQL